MAASYVIDFALGWSFGEPQPGIPLLFVITDLALSMPA
jgi:hypothetical protein